MKVLLILFRPEERDSGTLALDICRNAARYGIEVSVAASDPGDWDSLVDSCGSRFHLLENERPSDLNCVYRLRRFIREENFSVVHSFGSGEFILERVATIGKIPLKRVLHLQDQPFDRSSVSGKLGLASAIRMADATLVPSRKAFAVLREAGIDTRRELFFCPPGTDSERLLAPGKTFKMSLGLDRSHVLIGMKAPFGPDEIDQMTVCRSLPRVMSKFDGARFLFAGPVHDGGEEMIEECAAFCDEAGIGEKVFFVTDSDAIDPAFSSLDIFVYSSAGRSVPLVLAESMTMGIPSVVSDTEFLAEMTDGGRCADIFVRGDSEELADKLISLIKSDKLRKKRAKEAEDFAAENYSIDRLLMSLKALYSELVQGPAED